MKQRPHSLHSRDGSVLAVVLLVIAVLTMMLGSILRWGVTETNLSGRATYRTESAFITESTIEFGMSQLHERFNSRTSFPADELRSDPLNAPAVSDFQGGSTVTTVALRGGVVPNIERIFIPNDDAHADDPNAGQYVYNRGIMLLASTTITTDRFGDITTYAKQRLEARDVPLFSHAIFYNFDLQLFPGPDMDIRGPVHTNGDLQLAGGNTLDFWDSASAAGDMTYTSHPRFTTSGQARFPSKRGSSPNFKGYKDGGTRYTSDMSDWRQFASDRWRGFVQTRDHGVLAEIPAAFEDEYEASDGDLYSIIEPPEPNSAPGINKDLEVQKFASAAGITFDVRMYHYGDSYQPSGSDDDYEPYPNPIPASSTRSHHNTSLGDARDAYDANRVSDPNAVQVRAYKWTESPTGSYYRKDSTGAIKTYDRVEVTGSVGNLAGGSGSIFRTTDGGDPIKMWDARRRKWVHLVELDVGELKSAVESGSGVLSDNWNGVVYVNYETRTDDDGNGSFVASDLPDRSGLRVVNASSIPSYGSDPGMTLATNNAMYTKGHFNADGNMSTGSSTEPDDIDSISDVTASSEPPAALVADSIAVLSEEWNDRRSRADVRRRYGGSGNNHNDRVKPSHTEISAALMAGTSEMEFDSDGDAGANNFPRMLEHWSGRELRIRGSMVALYRSRVAWEPYVAYYTYRAPNRNWGFHDLFANGIFPPGTPNNRSYRRTQYKDIGKAEYDEIAAAMDDALDGNISTEEFDDLIDDISERYAF